MPNIYKVQAVWSGFLGGPGVNTFYFGDTPTSVSNLQDLYDDNVAGIPAGVTVSVLGEGVSIDSANGELTGAWSATGAGVTTGTGAGTVAGGSGAIIRWGTSGIVEGRRVLGRTFLVPLITAVFDTTGQVSPASQSAIATTASSFWGSMGSALGVWSRPKFHPDGSGTIIRNGSFHIVTSVQVPRTVAQLASRRD